jgi:hypothetical protein
MPKFSFIIAYRNRDIERVQRCINSLLTQTLNDYEIIFIDYGSSQSFKTEIADLLAKYPTITYKYLNTYGWLWCKSHALNAGISLAKGIFMVVVDIDLIYSPEFVKVFDNKVSNTTISIYQCYYLEENFTQYSSLDFNKSYNFQKSYETGTGLLIAPIEAVKKLGGFDTYFKVWGFEDMDMFKRLQSLGLSVQWIGVEFAATFHQWHAKNNVLQAMPQSWMATMREHWEFKPNHFSTHTDIETLLNLEKRPALLALHQEKQNIDAQCVINIQNNNLQQVNFQFTAPIAKSFVVFLATFAQAKQGQTFRITQTFGAIQDRGSSRLAKIFKFVNLIFEKLKISYRVTEIMTFESEMLYFTQIRDFLFYFIHSYENQIDDYYFETDGKENIDFIVVKK